MNGYLKMVVGALGAIGIIIAAFAYVFQIRADFDAYVKAHELHEINCANERKHINESIRELKRSVDLLHIELEKIKLPLWRLTNEETD